MVSSISTTCRGVLLMTLLLCVPIVHAGDTDNAKALYEAYCSQCHGLSGEGNGINAKHLEVAPRDHTDKVEMSARTDAELFKAISEGGQAVNKSVLMPAWKTNLSDEEITDIIAYLRVLCCE